MKKTLIYIIAAIALLAWPAGAYAQFRYGPQAGVTLSDLKFKQDLFEVDHAVGGSAGVAAEMIFPGIGIGIDLGLLYEMRGATLNLGQREMWRWQGYGRERLFLHYLEIPVHLRFKYTRMGGLEEYFAPIVYGGPDFGFLVGHSRCDAIDFAGGQIGLTAGAGVELWKHWQITAGYTWGVTYALKMKILSNDSARNGTWNIRVAYLF